MVRVTVMTADGEIVGAPAHGRDQTRYVERDTNDGRTAR
jgi:hypothetical protein